MSFFTLPEHPFKKALCMVVLHVIVFFITYFLMQYWGFISILPNNNNLLSWDASWYLSIKNFGYKFEEYKTCNLAFFPLFPFVWKLINVDTVTISVINAVIFFSSFYLLIKNELLPSIFILLILSIPSYIFFALPYSEALFFFFGTLIVIGYRNNYDALKWFGFLGASLTRSVGIIFVPTIIIIELLNFNELRTVKQKMKSIVLNIVGCLLGVFLTAAIQWYQTGKWFYFLEVQRFWRRNWLWPSFPLTTYDPERILGIETVSFALGLIAIFTSVFFGYTHLFRNKYEKLALATPSKAVLFSVLFVSATTILDTFFTFNLNASTSIWSMNRHVLCTPFAIMVLIWIYQNINKSTVFLVIVPCIIGLCLFLTNVGSYQNMLIQYLIFFVPYILLVAYPKSKKYLYVFYGINLIIQLYFLQDFLNGRWIA